MYWETKERFAAEISRMWRRRVLRSGLVPAIALGLLVAGLAFAYRERGRGHLHRLEERIVTAPRQDVPVPRPGGQEAMLLTRARLAGSSTPEFLSVTMLPGRGMNILQITAYIPDKGEVGLLDAPSVDRAAARMTGTGADADGAESLRLGAPFEVPWAGTIWGFASAGRVTANWRGHSISLPPLLSPTTASGGLLLAMPADSVSTTAMPDGGQGDAIFPASDFGAHWPSKTEVKTSVLLTGRSIEMTVTARNTGEVPEPIGIGWHPQFVILGDRRDLRLRIPASMRIERDRQTGQPTGEIVPVDGTPLDFTPREGVKLGTTDLDETFVQLHRDFLESGPITEMRNAGDNYGLRLTTLTGDIHALHVSARSDANTLSIDPSFSYDDPFGREWSREPDTGMVVLQPGQSTQWEIRLEIFALTGEPSPF